MSSSWGLLKKNELYYNVLYIEDTFIIFYIYLKLKKKSSERHTNDERKHVINLFRKMTSFLYILYFFFLRSTSLYNFQFLIFLLY